MPLEHPVLDKAVAMLAVVPLIAVAASGTSADAWTLEVVLLRLEVALIAVTMLSRHPARRVSRDWRLWVLALLTVYWPVLVSAAYEEGQSLVPRAISAALALVAFALSIWARLTLGRNIGIVPAERGLTEAGPYRWVRHPIYAALMLGIIAASLESWSLRNALLDAAWCLLIAVKSCAEERYLAATPAYAAYMTRVPYRWLPGRPVIGAKRL